MSTTTVRAQTIMLVFPEEQSFVAVQCLVTSLLTSMASFMTMPAAYNRRGTVIRQKSSKARQAELELLIKTKEQEHEKKVK